MKLTRQQHRQDRRKFNKNLKKEGTSRLGQKLLNKEKKTTLDEYIPSSKNTAVMPFCIAFNNEDDLNDYAFCCREGAETLLDITNPKFIILIRETGSKLPGSKKEMMKIGTRIFKKVAPRRIYIFLEAEGTQETADIHSTISNFLDKLEQVPDKEFPPKWLSEYTHEE